MSTENPKLIAEINRDNDTHSLEISGLSGRELLIIHTSLEKYIEEKAGMPIDIAVRMAAVIENEEEEERSGKSH